MNLKSLTDAKQGTMLTTSVDILGKPHFASVLVSGSDCKVDSLYYIDEEGAVNVDIAEWEDIIKRSISEDLKTKY